MHSSAAWALPLYSPITVAPCAKRASEIARPIPRVAPVTTAFCSVKVLTPTPVLMIFLWKKNSLLLPVNCMHCINNSRLSPGRQISICLCGPERGNGILYCFLKQYFRRHGERLLRGHKWRGDSLCSLNYLYCSGRARVRSIQTRARVLFFAREMGGGKKEMGARGRRRWIR